MQLNVKKKRLPVMVGRIFIVLALAACIGLILNAFNPDGIPLIRR